MCIIFINFVYNLNNNIMEQSFLKTGVTQTIDVVDTNTGEVIDTMTNKTAYLANSKEEFFMVYASALHLMMNTAKDVNVRLLAYLIQNNATGNVFSMSKGLKIIIADKINASPRTIDNSLSELIANKFIIRLERNTYKLNPRHVFQGGTSERNAALKAVLILECPDC